MEKLYTQKEYQQQAEQANKDGLFLYQLVKEQEYTIEVLEYEKKIVLQDVYSDDGKIIGSQEVEINDLTKPIMVEEEITNPETGEKETIIVQKHHTETRTKTVVELVIKPKGYYVCFKDNYTDGTIIEYFEEKELEKQKDRKLAENTTKAKQAVEDGYVTFKDAQFETNAQTVGDLTATMLMLQAQQDPNATYLWLSKDDKVVELTLEDFGTLGGLIAEYKNTIWQEKYIAYKTQIEQAQTVDAVNNINLDYAL